MQVHLYVSLFNWQVSEVVSGLGAPKDKVELAIQQLVLEGWLVGVKLRDGKSDESGDYKKKRQIKAERKDAERSVDAPLLAINMDKLVHEELKSFILDYCRVRLSTIGQKAAFADSVEFRVL